MHHTGGFSLWFQGTSKKQSSDYYRMRRLFKDILSTQTHTNTLEEVSCCTDHRASGAGSSGKECWMPSSRKFIITIALWRSTTNIKGLHGITGNSPPHLSHGILPLLSSLLVFGGNRRVWRRTVRTYFLLLGISVVRHEVGTPGLPTGLSMWGQSEKLRQINCFFNPPESPSADTLFPSLPLLCGFTLSKALGKLPSTFTWAEYRRLKSLRLKRFNLLRLV